MNNVGCSVPSKGTLISDTYLVGIIKDLYGALKKTSSTADHLSILDNFINELKTVTAQQSEKENLKNLLANPRTLGLLNAAINAISKDIKDNPFTEIDFRANSESAVELFMNALDRRKQFSFSKYRVAHNLDNDKDILVDLPEANITRMEIFTTDVLRHLIYYENKLIQNSKQLNQSIISLKKDWFNKLKLYLIEKDEFYRTKYKTSGGYINANGDINTEFIKDTDLAMKRVLKTLSQQELIKLLPSFLRLNFKESLDLTALAYYINLYNFDKLLTSKDGFGKIVEITKYSGSEVSILKSGSTKDIIIKYRFGKDLDHVAKSWAEADMTDAIAKTSRFSKLLLGLVEVHSYEKPWNDKTGILSLKLRLPDVSMAWSNLIKTILAIPESGDIDIRNLKEYAAKIKNDPGFYVPLILTILFKRGNTELRRSLLKLSNEEVDGRISSGLLSVDNMNILYSIYNTFYNTNRKDSLISVFNKSLLAGTHILSTYTLPDVITKLLVSNDMALYWKTELTAKGIESKPIYRTATASKKAFDHREALKGIYRRPNILGQTKMDKIAALCELKAVSKSGSKATIKIGGVTYYLNNYQHSADIKSPALWIDNNECHTIVTPELNSETRDKLFNFVLQNGNFIKGIGDIISDPFRSYSELEQEDNDGIKKLDIRNTPINTLINAVENEVNANPSTESRQLLKELKEWRDKCLLFFDYFNKPLTEKRIRELLNEGEHGDIKSILTLMEQVLNIPLSSLGSLRILLDGSIRLGKPLTTVVRYLLHTLKRDPKTALTINPIGNPSWIDKYFNIEAKLNGQENQAIIKDSNNVLHTLFRQTSLGAQLIEECNKHKLGIEKAKVEYSETHKAVIGESESERDKRIYERDHLFPLSRNIFVRDSSLIKTISYDASLLAYREEKEVKNATLNEICYNSIHNHFIHQMATSGKFSVMPTVYSDKTSILIYQIDGNRIIEIRTPEGVKEVNFFDCTELQFLELYYDSVVSYHKRQYDDAINTFKTLFGSIDENIYNDIYRNKGISFKKFKGYSIREKLRATTPALLEELLRTYQKINKKPLTVIADTHYRVVGGYLDFNESSYYYAHTTLKRGIKGNYVGSFAERFDREKLNFIDGLLKNNVILEWDEDTKNFPIFKKENKVNEDLQKEYLEEWVLEDRLILAKYNGVAITSRQLLEEIKKLALNKLLLNPILEKYYYMDIIASENLKNVATGNELADPLKNGPILKDEFNPKKDNIYGGKDAEEIQALKLFLLNFPEEYNKIINGSLIDLAEVITKLKNIHESLNAIESNTDLIPLLIVLEDKYDRLSSACIAITLGAQYKRNVVLPATGDAVVCNTLTGLGSIVKKAVFDDPLAKVFGPNGKDKNIDARDGSALISPYMAILMNNSFIDSPGSFDLLKPLWITYNAKTGTSGLDKYAVDTLSTKRMRLLGFSSMNEYNLFKKTHSMKWDPTLDLCNSCMIGKTIEVDKKLTTRLSFGSIILLVRAGARVDKLLYKNFKGNIVLIKDFVNLNKYVNGEFNYNSEGLDANEQLYATLEQIVDAGVSKLRYVVTLFDDNSESIKIRQGDNENIDSFIKRVTALRKLRNLHTASTLFELFLVFGGLDAVLEEVDPNDGKIVYNTSESAHFAVAAVMNNVLEETPWDEEWGEEPKDLTIEDVKNEYAKQGINISDKEAISHVREENKKRAIRRIEMRPKSLRGYRLPLKELFIGQCAYRSATKRNAANINSSRILESNNLEEVLYIEDSAHRLYKQQDLSHSSEEADTTEMSQVVASLDVGGENHHIAKLAYSDLAKLIRNAIKKEYELLKDSENIFSEKDEEKRNKLLDNLYDNVVRAFLNNYKEKNFRDLTEAIVKEVKLHFDNSNNHQDDSFYLPISDPNIFRAIIEDFVNRVNSMALKRRYSGSGDILAPAYNSLLLFHINGERYMYLDLVQKTNPTITILTEKGIRKSSLINSIINRAKNTAYTKTWRNGKGSNTSYFFTFDEGFLYLESLDNGDGTATKLEGLDRYKYIDPTDGQYKEASGFELVRIKDNNGNDTNNEFAIHFKTPRRNLTELLKVLLLLAIREFLPNDAKVVLSGEVTKGGFSGFSRLKNLGFIELTELAPSTPYVKDEQDAIAILTKYGYNTEEYLKGKRVARVHAVAKGALSKTKADELLVLALLKDQQKNAKYFRNVGNIPNENTEDLPEITEVAPTDIVDIYYIDKAGREVPLLSSLNLDDPDLYYTFIDAFANKDINALKELLKRVPQRDELETINEGIYLRLRVKLNVTTPRNLRPQLIWFNGIDENGNLHKYSIFNLDIVRYNIKNKEKQNIQSTMRAIENGGIVTINGKSITVIKGSLINLPAELLMNNTHKAAFNLPYGQSLALTKESFRHREIIHSNIEGVNLVLLGRKRSAAILINLNPLAENIREFLEHYIYIDNPESGVVEIWLKDQKTNQPLYMVGIGKPLEDKVYDKKKKAFLNKDGVKIENEESTYFNFKGKVYETSLFMKRVIGVINKDGGKEEQLYLIFNTESIDDYIKNYYNSEEEKLTPTKYIALTLKKITTVSKYTHIQATQNASLLKDSLELELLKDLRYKNDAYKFFDECIIAAERFLKSNKLNLEVYEEDLKRCYKIFLSEQYNSFLMSLFFTSARIPSQNLSSFMLMECVGFLDGDENIACVSHWLTWLLGSDYDIDKSYLMGFNFDQNGKFNCWSPLFDFSTIETLQASLEIPVPSNVKITYVRNAKNADIDISELIATIRDLEAKGDKSAVIKAIADLIILIDEAALDNKIKIYANSDTVQRNNGTLYHVVDLIKEHEKYLIPEEIYGDVILNAISSKILRIVNNAKSYRKAYTPVTLASIKVPANNSTKGNLIVNLTSLNPYSKFEMFRQNMVGKNVISVAANGEKVFMGLTFYYNEKVRLHQRLLEIDRSRANQLLRRLLFAKETTRILGRYNSDPTKYIRPIRKIKTTIADINYFNRAGELEEELLLSVANINLLKLQYEKLGKSPEKALLLALRDALNSSDADDMISQLLSAATDNAKELILAKINCNMEFARMYIHLIILGYDIKDIVAFMTSPAVELIIDEYNTNIFLLDSSKQNENEYLSKKIARIRSAAMHNLRINKTPEQVAEELAKQGLAYAEGEDFKTIEDELIDRLVKRLLSTGKIVVDGKILTTIPEGTTSILFLYDNITRENANDIKTYLLTTFVKEEAAIDNGEIINSSNIYKILRWYNDFEKYALQRSDAIKSIMKTFNISRALAVEDFESDLDEFQRVYEDAGETHDLATVFNISKTVSPDYNEICDKISRLEKIINKRINKFIKSSEDLNNEKKLEKIKKTLWELNGGHYVEVDGQLEERGRYTHAEIENILKRAATYGITDYFNLEDFIVDKNGTTEYREAAIDLYDLVKKQFNVLDILLTSPLYMAAGEALCTVFGFLKILSMKGKAVNIIRKELLKLGVQSDDNRLNAISDFIESKMVLKFFKEGSDILFTYPAAANSEYIKAVDGKIVFALRDTYTDATITSDVEMASFKNWFENDFLYLFAQGEIIVNGEAVDVSQLKLHRYLVDTVDRKVPAIKLSILMNLVLTNPEAAKEFADMMQEVRAALNSTIGKRIIDWIAAYNLVQYHNKPGNDRINKIFYNLLGREDNLIRKWAIFVGDMDKKMSRTDSIEDLENELDFSILDIEYETAELFNIRTLSLANDRIIKYDTGNGYTEWKVYNNSTRFYETAKTIPSDVDSLRIINQYFKSFSFIRDTVQGIKNTFKVRNKLALKEALVGLIKKRTLKILLDC